MKRALIFALNLIIIILSFSSVFALSPDTLEDINKFIAYNAFDGFALDEYLKERIGFTGGNQHEINSFYVWYWLREGGRKEDVPYWYMPYLRSVNHFHNPLTDLGFLME